MKMNEFIARLKQQPRIGGVPRINVPAAAAATTTPRTDSTINEQVRQLATQLARFNILA